MADVIESTIGTSPVLKIYDDSAGVPANPAASALGTVLSTMTLPSDWLTNPGDGTKALNGTWQDASAAHTGLALYFRIYDSTATTCHIQGTVSLLGAGGELAINNGSAGTAGAPPSITAGQVITAVTFTLTTGNS